MSTTAETTDNEVYAQRWQGSVMDNYGTPKLTLVRGEGAHVWDADGTGYIDFIAGIAVNSLGHAHPAVVEAASHQIATLGHVSNLYISEPPVALAEKLLQLLGRPGKVYFCNSGAEANEAALKIARRTGRPEIVSTVGAFHGRTMGALSLTGQPAKKTPFEPLLPNVTFVPYGDADALRAAVGPQTAAVIVEPVQGENGVVTPPAGYLADVREITTAAGALFILDEVQTGIGRMGAWFAHQSQNVQPDVVTLAKGLGGGLPIGATVAFGPAADLFTPGQHGTTFGGNPVCCAVALAVLQTIESEGLCERAALLGDRIKTAVAKLNHPLVDRVEGEGLLLGIVLTQPVSAAVQAAGQERGLLLNAPAPHRIRLAPPLVVTDEDVDALLTALPGILDAAASTIKPGA